MPPKKTKEKRSSFEEAIKKGLTKEEYEKQEFDIKDIVGMRFLKKEVRFHVKWEGYTTDDDSWEPIESFLNSPEAFNAFRDKLLVEPPEPPVGNQDNHPVEEKTKRSKGRPSLREAYMNGLTLEEFNRKNFEIERISKVRIFEGVVEFRVQWKGFGNCYDTWEPMNCFGYAPQALKNFLNMMLPPALPISTIAAIVGENEAAVSPGSLGSPSVAVPEEEQILNGNDDPVRRAGIDEVATPHGVNCHSAAEEMHGEGTQKRGRGRPRKRAASHQENKENQLIIPKRARGRPRKNAQSVTFSETKTENTNVPTSMNPAGPPPIQVHIATVCGSDIAEPLNQKENNMKLCKALMEAAEKHRPKKFRNAFAFPCTAGPSHTQQQPVAAFDTNPMLDSGSSSSPSSSRRKNSTTAMEATSSEPSSSRMQSNSIPPPMDTVGPSQIQAHVAPVARDDITTIGPQNQKEHVDAEHSRSAESSPVPTIHPRGYSALVMSLPMKFTNIGSLQDCSRMKNNTDVMQPTTSGPSTDRGIPEVPEPIMLRMPDNAMNAKGMPTERKVNRRNVSVRNQLNEELLRARLEKIEHIEEIENGYVTGALHKNQFDVPKMKPAADRSQKDNLNILKMKRPSRKEGTRTVKQCPNKCRPRSTRMCKMCKIEEKYMQELAYCSDIESGGEDLLNEKFVAFEDKENDVISKQESKKEDKGHEIVFASWDKEIHEAEGGYDADEDTDTEVPLSPETKLKMITPSPPAENPEVVLEKKPSRLPPLPVPPIPPCRVYLDDRGSVKEEKPTVEGKMAGIKEKIQIIEEKPMDEKFDGDSVSDEMEVFIIDDEREEDDVSMLMVDVPETTKLELKDEVGTREQKMRENHMPKCEWEEKCPRCEDVPNHDAHEAEQDEDQLVGERGVFENDPHRVEDTAGNEGQESEEGNEEEVFEEFPGYKKERSPEPSMQCILAHLDEQKLAETLLMNELKQIEAMPWGRDRCNFCGEHWASELCNKYPTHNKRLGFVRKYHACHSCGSTKHRVTGCERLLACVYCKKSAHHLQMCSIFSTDFVKDYHREPHPKGPLKLKVPSKRFGSKKRSRRRRAQKA